MGKQRNIQKVMAVVLAAIMFFSTAVVSMGVRAEDEKQLVISNEQDNTNKSTDPISI